MPNNPSNSLRSVLGMDSSVFDFRQFVQFLY
jgi:hypothetical protein